MSNGVKERKAQMLREAMEQATADGNKEAFLEAYTKAFNYMRKKDRVVYYKRFIGRMIEIRRAGR